MSKYHQMEGSGLLHRKKGHTIDLFEGRICTLGGTDGSEVAHVLDSQFANDLRMEKFVGEEIFEKDVGIETDL